MTVLAGMAGAAALKSAVRRLRAAGVESPERDARRLLAWALGIGTDRLAIALPDTLGEEDAALFEGAVAARLERRPVSQITGRRLFWGREFRLDHTVLDPRPETECLIARALELPFGRILDIGTGTGCILLTLLAERPSAIGVGTDISRAAVSMAEGNAVALGLSDRARIVAALWTHAMDADERIEGPFDLILSNPPYIARTEMAALAPEVRDWEPRLALTDEGDGLTAYRAIAAEAPALLSPRGRILLEIGPTQSADVCAILASHGLSVTNVHSDLDGRDRVVEAWHAKRT